MMVTRDNYPNIYINICVLFGNHLYIYMCVCVYVCIYTCLSYYCVYRALVCKSI